MTREEAKEILTHNWTRVDNPYYSESELDEAFFMAIEALSDNSVSRRDTVTLNSPISIQAEMVAVVRCKECKYYREETGSCTAEHWDLSRVTFPHVEQNDYCSYGENKK